MITSCARCERSSPEEDQVFEDSWKKLVEVWKLFKLSKYLIIEDSEESLCEDWKCERIVCERKWKFEDYCAERKTWLKLRTRSVKALSK